MPERTRVRAVQRAAMLILFFRFVDIFRLFFARTLITSASCVLRYATLMALLQHRISPHFRCRLSPVARID